MAGEWSTAGILLRSVAYAEADQVCTFLTAERGKLTAFARGARRSKRRFRGGLNTFSELHLVLKDRAGDRLPNLVESEAERTASEIGADLAKMAVGTYLLELLDLSLADGQGAEAFGSVVRFFRWLVTEDRGDGHVEAGLHRIELLLLSEAGVLPDFGRCARTGEALDEDTDAQWIPEVGVVRADARHPGEQAVAVSPRTRRYVRSLAAGRFPAADASDEREELREGLHRVWQAVTGRDQRSYRFMADTLEAAGSG